MNKNTTNYESDRPQVAVENIDFYNDKLPWTIKALVIPALVMVFSIGLPSTVGAVEIPCQRTGRTSPLSPSRSIPGSS